MASLALRLRQFPQAIVTLYEARRLGEAIPANLAFLAMMHYQLGQKEQAEAALAQEFQNAVAGMGCQFRWDFRGGGFRTPWLYVYRANGRPNGRLPRFASRRYGGSAGPGSEEHGKLVFR